MFEAQYNELALAVDLIAERIRALGLPAPGTYKQFSALSAVKEEDGVPKAQGGRDDIVSFTGGSAGDVFVALSQTNSTFGASTKWHDWFAPNSEIPRVADVNGDGLDDIITFLRGSSGDVYVAVSNGSSFGAGQLWHGDFAFNSEIPYVADFSGDGRGDAVTFVGGTTGTVYVAKATNAW